MPDKLQGTDGIRREVRLSTHPSVAGLSPSEAFILKDIITEEFCELYTYSYVSFLKQTGNMRDGEAIVIGWDPRDKMGDFTKSAMNGIRRAGGKPLVLGIVPTPLVPLFVIDKNAAGGVMITASHNPPDQNGIKLFIRGTGVKPLPVDDTRITEEILKTDFSLLKRLPLKYPEENMRNEALDSFKKFSLDPLNSWINDACEFSKTHIVVDPANGSFAGLAADLFEQAGFNVTEVSADASEDVNKDCGVVEFEGIRFAHSAESEKGKKFEHSKILSEVFKKGKELNDQLKTGEARVSGAIFDADGDRFIRLDYDPFKERVIVSSGDETAFFQADYIMRTNPEKFMGTSYINTVESDLNASIAAEKLGYKPVLTGVGDKWLLLESLFLSLEAAPGFNENIDELRKKQDLSSIDLSKLVTSTPPALKNLKFAIGAEESGHTVTTGFLRSGDKLKPVFIGNGFKSAINSFASTESLGKGKTPAEFYRIIEEPFDPGYKKTLYVYYIKKNMLSSGSPFRENLKSYSEKLITGLFGPQYSVSVMERAEEPDMLYFSVHKKEDGLLRAGIYIRNSGTEDKTGVNLRGCREDKELLDKAGDTLRDYLLPRLKDPKKPDFITEREILLKTGKEGDLAIEKLRSMINGANVDRLLKEMVKQGLITSQNNKLELTDTGFHYTQHLREKQNEP